MNCPAREKLELHYEGALDAAESASIAAHAAACESCGGHLRRLQEEAEALRRNLPDVAAPAGLARLVPPVPAANPWKPVALFAVAAALLLSVGMIWMSRRASDGWESIRRNVQAQVKFHLDKGEPEKAIGALAAFPTDPESRKAADAARVEIAAKCDDAEAARLLDQVDLADKNLDDAERIASARLAVYERLFAGVVLQKGAVPTPFELKPYLWEERRLPPLEEMSRITARLLTADIERRDVATRRGTTAPASDYAGLARITMYALGETGYENMKPANETERLALGDVLYRERQFDRAIEIWKPVISNEKVYRKLAELAALKRLAPTSLNVWDYEVETLLGAHPDIDKEAAAKIEGLFRRAKDGVITLGPRERLIDTKQPAEEDPIFDPPVRQPEIASDPDQVYLLVDHQQFRLETPADRPFTAKAGAALTLKSAYRGPIRARLYRAPDLAFFTTLTERNVVERRRQLTLVQEWETTFEPMSKNGEMGTFRLETPRASAGLFVLVAEARYCPVYAVAKFIVTDTALVQQVAADRILVFAADRVTGDPIPGVALAGEVTGEYVLKPEDAMPSDDSNADEFRRGFETGWGGKDAEADAGPSWMRGFQRAKDLRAAKPDAKSAFAGSTGKDGLFESMLTTPWRDDYRYRVKTTTTAADTYSRVESDYAVDAKLKMPRALVYSDRPVYRPGDRVRFKAMLRVLDNEGLHPWEGREALIEFGTRGRTLFAKAYPVGDFGTADGDFDLPFDVETGSYWARVGNGASIPLFVVEEYRKPEFAVTIHHPEKVKAGAPVVVDIAVRTYSGDPVAGARVDFWVSASPLRSVHDPKAAWIDVESRTLTTDASGLCVTRFTTDAGMGARYVLSARASDPASRREAMERSTLEAAGPVAAGVYTETDRPSYYPGERAIIRVRADGAAAVRLEERTEYEKRFTATIALERGLAQAEYIVPETPQALHVGVRVGDEWAWTPVALAITPRAAEGALTVRPDKSVYRPGETAKISIRAGERGQHVLVEVGTGRILRREVIKVEGDAVVEIPVTPELVPNVAVVAVGVRADALLKATADVRVPPVDRFLTVEVETDKPEYGPGEECKASVRVVDWQGNPVRDCEISLGVVDESVYAIEEDRTPDLRDYFHKYERRLAFTESFFFREAPGAFIVWKAPTFVRGMRSVYDIIGAGGGGGGRYGGRFGGKKNLVSRGGGAGATEGYVRSSFQDTAHWEAALRTNAEGVATASFRFPDNLTSFRFTARGITRDTKVGAVRQRAVVRKPFYVRIAASRVVQEGNALAIAATVHNMTADAQMVRVAFKGSYPVLASTAPATMTVAAGAVEKVEYLVSVDRWLPDAAFSFRARSESGLEDGVEITVPGRRHGAPFNDGRAGSVAAANPTEEVFRVPDGVIPGTLVLKLNLDAGVHAAVVEGLEPLIEYPYGCIEQTMSRFFPAAVASRAVGQAPNRWSEKLPSVVAAGLRRVYSFQHADGSWGWFRNDSSNAGMTSYVLYGLAVAKKSGVGVDRGVADRAASFLRTTLDGMKERSPLGRSPLPADVDRRVYIVLALSEYETAWGAPAVTTRRLASSLAARDEERSPIDDVMLAIACRRLGLVDDAERLAKRAETRPMSDVATAALTLQLQAERGGNVAEAVRFLMTRREGKGWRTTIESAYAILGLSALLERAKPGDYQTPGRMTVEVNGVAAKSLELPSALDAAFDGRISVPEPAEGWRGKIVVRLTFDGRGVAFYTATLAGMLGGEDRPAASRGLEIVREYYEEDGKSWRRVDGQVPAGRPVLVRLRITSPTEREYVMVVDPRPDGFEPRLLPPLLTERRRAGGTLTDRIDLTDGWQARLDVFRREVRGDAARESTWAKAVLREVIEKRRFVAEGADEDVSFPDAVASTIDHRDDRTIFFVARLPAGQSSLYYVVKPELAGELHVLAPTATPMYEPEIFAAGVEQRLTSADGRLLKAAPRGLDLPAGVEGLLTVIDAMGTVDADALISRATDRTRIGVMLMTLADEKALRAWLSYGTGTRADLAVRMLAASALDFAPDEWRGAVEEALLAPARVAAGDLDDGALQWVREDRAFRTALIEAVQWMKRTSRIEGAVPPGVTIEKILASSKGAPVGEALTAWKLSQRVEGGALALSELLALIERDLGIPVTVISSGPAETTPPGGRTVSDLLDEALSASKRYWKVKDGAIRIGTLDELLK